MFFFSEGPTSYGPVIEAAIDIVEKNRGQFHVLVIVADGQVYHATSMRPCWHVCLKSYLHILFYLKVTRSVNCDDGELSPQEEKTIQAIVDAR